MLDSYMQHLKSHPDSLLAKIYGVFTVNTDNLSDVHIILMDNTLKLKSRQNLLKVFDLKGSLVDRYVKMTNATKPSSTLKDKNLL